ncbi:hypothetical protein [Maribacter sp. 2210JD10-5]|uniref:hypothetical protein n=1 Tax=Maribacter sp. 2210JD10-5 TaxID=3386272 RepID=UPI0039BCC447
MIKPRSLFLICSGILFTYYGLKGEFILAYSGSALVMAWTSFFLAFSQISKEKAKIDNRSE